MKPKLWIIALGVTLAVCFAWYAGSPWWTVKSMRDAAQAHDSSRLASYVDFPQVRRSVRDQLAEQIEARTSASPEQALVNTFAGALLNPVVDRVVSPEALRLAMVGKVDPGNVDRQSKIRDQEAACGIQREGLSQFRLRCAAIANGRADFIFERRGLGWVMVGVDLPADYGASL